MSQSEIWDDSALVDSWNAALDEYKRYHSIHARGEQVVDVLRAFDADEQHSASAQAGPSDAAGAVPAETPSAGLASNVDGRSSCDAPQHQPAAAGPEGLKPLSRDAVESQRDGLDMPPPLLATVQDEGLKSLLMAWYYAGYYTGLYEGQKQAQEPSAAGRSEQH